MTKKASIILTLINLLIFACTLITALWINPGNGDRDKRELIKLIENEADMRIEADILTHEALVGHLHKSHMNYGVIIN